MYFTSYLIAYSLAQSLLDLHYFLKGLEKFMAKRKISVIKLYPSKGRQWEWRLIKLPAIRLEFLVMFEIIEVRWRNKLSYRNFGDGNWLFIGRTDCQYEQSFFLPNIKLRRKRRQQPITLEAYREYRQLKIPADLRIEFSPVIKVD